MTDGEAEALRSRTCLRSEAWTHVCTKPQGHLTLLCRGQVGRRQTMMEGERLLLALLQGAAASCPILPYAPWPDQSTLIHPAVLSVGQDQNGVSSGLRCSRQTWDSQEAAVHVQAPGSSPCHALPGASPSSRTLLALMRKQRCWPAVPPGAHACCPFRIIS